jgi:integrase
MAGAKLEPTRYPAIYRRGRRYVYEWTSADGQRRRGTAETLDDARRLKAEREDETRAGIPTESVRSTGRMTVGAYAREMFGCDIDRPAEQAPARGRFQGRRGAIRRRTLDTYRRDLENHVLPTLGGYKLDALKSQHIKRLLADLAAREGDAYLRDTTLRAIFAPLRGMLAEAAEEGLIDHNPAAVVKVPSGRDALRAHDGHDGQELDDEDDPTDGTARALTRAQLATFLALVHPDWRVMFELLAVTGLRISEASALRWQDLVLDGGHPHVRVRRSYVAPHFGPPKSRYGKRDVPIALELADRLRVRRSRAELRGQRDLVFPSKTGTPLRTENVRRRVLKPAGEEAGVSWIGFHAFRHSCASTLIAEGRNIVQVSRWLGHHSPAFTLTVYAHLLDEGVGEPLAAPSSSVPQLDAELAALTVGADG